MPIDLATVDWIYVGVLAVLAFLATVVANIVSFGHRGMAALLSAIIFAALFVSWTYYPHGLPLPTRLAGQPPAPIFAPPAQPPAAVAPAAPERPRNPVTDITPPAPAR